ncbi:hypothetical protein P3T25_008973 [Paraburkholderia sp. GAS32]
MFDAIFPRRIESFNNHFNHSAKSKQQRMLQQDSNKKKSSP